MGSTSVCVEPDGSVRLPDTPLAGRGGATGDGLRLERRCDGIAIMRDDGDTAPDAR